MGLRSVSASKDVIGDPKWGSPMWLLNLLVMSSVWIERFIILVSLLQITKFQGIASLRENKYSGNSITKIRSTGFKYFVFLFIY